MTLGLACIAMVSCGAVSEPVRVDQYSPTEESARKILDEAVKRVRDKGVLRFCEGFTVGLGSCNFEIDHARRFCLNPGSPPSILRSSKVSAAKGRSQGWVLEVEGRTQDGQRYVSEFFVMSQNGKSRAHVGVYWTGLGLAQSPLGPRNTVVPKSACSSRSQS